jgi:hypothetical protein
VTDAGEQGENKTKPDLIVKKPFCILLAMTNVTMVLRWICFRPFGLDSWRSRRLTRPLRRSRSRGLYYPTDVLYHYDTYLIWCRLELKALERSRTDASAGKSRDKAGDLRCEAESHIFMLVPGRHQNRARISCVSSTKPEKALNRAEFWDIRVVKTNAKSHFAQESCRRPRPFGVKNSV